MALKCTFRKHLSALFFTVFISVLTLAQNPIVIENSRPGNPASEWDIAGKNAGDLTIQGFATDISVNKGDTVHFKISTSATNYTIEIYRLGYYNGLGARKIGDGTVTATLPQVQPTPLTDLATGLVDCGNWAESGYWKVPDTVVSGVYIAKLTRTDNNGRSHIVFIVRDDASTSDLFFQTSDATWQAYNNYGGNSLYTGATSFPGGRAAKVSYNRPMLARSGGGGGGFQEDFLFNAEYPMIRFLERNGYDISYTTNVDVARRGHLILNHKVFMSVGHDEYWSAEQRNNVTAARNAGVHLAFFSGNEIYWKTRWENSIDNSATPYRTLVCYKEGTQPSGEFVCGGKCDPSGVWTGLWRFGNSYDAGLPENGLSGQISWRGSTAAIKVPSAYKNLRFWRNTSIASMPDGTEATLAEGTLGYEWNFEQFTSSYPSGRITMSSTTIDTSTHKLSLYRHASGAYVFGAGTVQWAWGLDSVHDRGNAPADIRMQQATVNLLADMGVQPETLQNDLVAAAASTDITPPQTIINFPPDGTTFTVRKPITISGTSSDIGGVVAGVEISIDGGATWRVATGTTNWSYTWSQDVAGTIVVKVRGFDDSGNIEAEGTAPSPKVITLNIVNPECPCSLFNVTDNPSTKNAYNGFAGLEVGTRFKSDSAGYVTGLRFYKSTLDTGKHVLSLWTSDGTLLARDSLMSWEEKKSGWHDVVLDTPVPIDPGTIYVVSYFSPSGRYARSSGYFSDNFVNGILSAPKDDSATGNYNGVIRSTSSPAFPDSYGNGYNYWVDVDFNTSLSPDTTAPVIEIISPVAGQTNITVNTTIEVEFNSLINSSSVNSSSVFLKDAGNNTIPVTIYAVQDYIQLTPQSPLDYSSTYTVTIKGGPGGVTDLAGNALVSDSVWSFTTASALPPFTAEGHGGPILVVMSSANPFSKYTTEILRAEGLNDFMALDITSIDAATLSGYDVAIIGEINISNDQAAMFADWVNAGGKLIAFKPDASLHSLLGITETGSQFSDGYILIDTASGKPGHGIVGETIQYHSAADLYILNGASAIATLYTDANTATSYPAVTVNNVGSNGGKAVAFAYDLSRSVVYTRQGNPDLAGIETDGQTPVRANDMFFPNYLNMDKVAIPQADEQQRLLANIILQYNLNKKPLPRLWYLPKKHKAAILFALDDHGTANGTKTIFDKMIDNSPAGCSIDGWECYRATSWFFHGIPLTNGAAVNYHNEGFEMGIHVQNGCTDFTSFANLDAHYTSQLQQFANTYPGLPTQTTHRFHCLVWSDWLTQAKVERAHNIRLSMDYYYWPSSWINGRSGLFTGSGIPMKYADKDGTIIDIYQAPSQLVNENGLNYTADVNTLVANAVGPKGYYGIFGVHDDFRDNAFSNASIAAAKAYNIPIISAKQALKWLDGRNNSYFNNMTWSNDTLSFNMVQDANANNLTGMLPLFSENGQLNTITRDGSPVAFVAETIKGIKYALFDAKSGNYIAAYGPVDEGTLLGTVVMQGRPEAPSSRLEVPLEVTLYLNGNAGSPQAFNVTTDLNGVFSIHNIPVGSYSIAIKNSHTLRKVQTSQEIVLGPNTINFGTLLEGDVNNDNYVDGLDFSLLLNSFFRSVGHPSFDPQADLNGDGFVDGLDLSLLLNNFFTAGESP